MEKFDTHVQANLCDQHNKCSKQHVSEKKHDKADFTGLTARIKKEMQASK